MSNKCPKCGKEITYLKHYQTCEVGWDFDGEDYNNQDFIDGTDPEYTCPECDQTLFTNEEDAIEFLKNSGGA